VMKRSRAIDGSSLARRAVSLGVCLICLFLPILPLYAQPTDLSPLTHFNPGTVQLDSRVIEPSKETTTEFLNALKSSQLPQLRGLATFSQKLSDKDISSLSEHGIHVISRVHGTTYRVRVEKTVDIDVFRAPNLKFHLFLLQPQDRVRSSIWQGDFKRYQIRPPGDEVKNQVLNPDGTINITVRFYSDVPVSTIERKVRSFALKYNKQSETVWVVTIKRAELQQIATDNDVRWIDAGPPPFIPENNHTRPWIGVDDVQNFNLATKQVLGLGGNGVRVAIFDTGFDQSHEDFAGRVLSSSEQMSKHGTHVAGTIASDGNLSVVSGSPYPILGTIEQSQWRGMAPKTKLIEAVVTERTPNSGLFTGAEKATHLALITQQGMDISNHSYGVTYDGVYDSQNVGRDELIRGVAVENGTQIPGRLQIYSAGNQGSTKGGISNQLGYFSITKELKNGLVVGNWNHAGPIRPHHIDDSSSLGPAYDGRIKPDVVAPGNSITSTCTCVLNHQGKCDNPSSDTCTYRGAGNTHGYMVIDGSSMAAPAVTGTLALVIEKYRDVNGATTLPLPSSLRAVMIHTAIDLYTDNVAAQTSSLWCNADGPSSTPCPVGPSGGEGHAAVWPKKGPDFVTGWGRINAKGAVNIVANRLVLEDSISSDCDTKTYIFTVPQGTPTLRVTLAWDDLPADEGRPIHEKKLVNDLDLVVISPSTGANQGVKHYPWRLNQTLTPSIGNDDERCPLSITASGLFSPNSTLGQPDVSIPSNGFPPAERGRDHLNNVEVVDVDAPVAGTWKVQVKGFDILTSYDERGVGPQKFSLVAPFLLAVAPPENSVPPAPPTGLRVN
jgi:subtilisin family serine protease